MNAIADVQSSKDLRNMPINQVGIKDLRFPLQITTASGTQSTVARLTMTVRLPAEQKGTHMSRFVALMEDRRRELDYGELKDLTQRMLELLDSDAGKISIAFPFSARKPHPYRASARCWITTLPSAAKWSAADTATASKCWYPLPRSARARRKFRNTARTTSVRTLPYRWCAAKTYRWKRLSTLSKTKPPANFTAS